MGANKPQQTLQIKEKEMNVIVVSEGHSAFRVSLEDLSAVLAFTDPSIECTGICQGCDNCPPTEWPAVPVATRH